jgi:ribosomal protein S14
MAAAQSPESPSSSKQSVRCRDCGNGAVVRTLPRGSRLVRDLRRPFRHLHDLRERAGGGPEAAA